MKTGIHPEYKKISVTCNCGANFELMSTREYGKADICSQCHPFYTGKQKLVDTTGQVEKFKARRAAAAKMKAARAGEEETVAEAPAEENTTPEVKEEAVAEATEEKTEE